MMKWTPRRVMIAAAVADAGRMEQAIEALHARKTVSVVVPLVALRHLSIVVENAARIDELIVRAEESHHLSAACSEGVKRAERVGNVGDVARAGFRHFRV